MKKNVIILTGGISGSSVLASLISRAGYWTGEDTQKKVDYDTYENLGLVELNKQLLAAAQIGDDYTMVFNEHYFDQVTAVQRAIDTQAQQQFVADCNQHQPWLWKDPRLWLTIGFWQQFVDFESVQFIVITREDLQAWISTTLRRQIQTYQYSKRYNQQVTRVIIDFLQHNQQPYLQLSFEQLICQPESTIAKLNDYLATELTMDDVTSVYNKPLYNKPHGVKNLSKAALIYLRNYGQRYR